MVTTLIGSETLVTLQVLVLDHLLIIQLAQRKVAVKSLSSRLPGTLQNSKHDVIMFCTFLTQIMKTKSNVWVQQEVRINSFLLDGVWFQVMSSLWLSFPVKSLTGSKTTESYFPFYILKKKAKKSQTPFLKSCDLIRSTLYNVNCWQNRVTNAGLSDYRLIL